MKMETLLMYLSHLMIVLMLILSCSSDQHDTLVIRGSDTEVNLVLELAEYYMEMNSEVAVAVTGGGSGTGVAALINGKTDLANSSRTFTQEEYNLAKDRGVDVTSIVFAMDALSFIVHPSLPVDSLTIQELKLIYCGDIDNWEYFGGRDMSISLYGRQSNSGTFSYVQSEILGADYSQNMKMMNGSSQIVESIKKDLAGIGYVGIGYVTDEEGLQISGVKVLTIARDTAGKYYNPLDKQAVRSGSYPVVRPLFQYMDGKPKDRLKEFIEFELSPQGQHIISGNGYFPVSREFVQQNQIVLYE